MKFLLVLVSLGSLACSRTFYERAGFAVPKPQSSTSLQVLEPGFVLLPRSKEVVLSVTLKVTDAESGGRILRVTFPEGETKALTEVVSLALEGEPELRARSSALSGLEYLDIYPVRIQLLSGQDEVLEEFTQYVRFEVTPSSLEKMGVAL